MKILDITVDLETLALTPNAAIMQIAAVAWKRDSDETPFFMTHWTGDDKHNGWQQKALAAEYVFYQCIDLRSCVSLGMDFDQKTVDFWSRQKPDVKAEVLGGSSRDICFQSTLHHIYDTLAGFISWAKGLAAELDEQGCAIRLWSQGSDFDIAILRNACHKCGLTEQFDKVFPHTSFRDARTFILELGRTLCTPHAFPLHDSTLIADKNIYNALPPFAGEKLTHDALYDCQKTTWQVWSVMRQHAKQYSLNCSTHED